MTLHVRPFKLTDTVPVIALASELAAHHGDQSKLTPDFLRHAVARPECRILVATKDMRPVGFASLQRRTSISHAIDNVHIDNIVVGKKARGQGIGRMLVQSAAKHAIDSNATGLTLFFRRENADAREFYEALGFNIRPYTEQDHRAEMTGAALSAFATPKMLKKSEVVHDHC